MDAAPGERKKKLTIVITTKVQHHRIVEILDKIVDVLFVDAIRTRKETVA